MLSSFTMERIKNGWLLILSFEGKQADEAWFCSTFEKGLKRISKWVEGSDGPQS